MGHVAPAPRARRVLHDAAGLLKAALTLGERQRFLGAAWMDMALTVSPPSRRYAVARRLLSLSPHYVYVPSEHGTKVWPRAAEIETELERNRHSRRQLVRDLLGPHILRESVVLDYGCGAGFAAVAAAEQVRLVYGVDIATSILRCAQLLNGRPNIHYRLVDGERVQGVDDHSVDLCYSLAVFQHLTEDAGRRALAEIARVTRPDGTLVMHVVLDAPGWRSERERERESGSRIVRSGDASALVSAFTASPADATRSSGSSTRPVLGISRSSPPLR